MLRGDFAEARAQANELVLLAQDKGAVFWTASGNMGKSWVDLVTVGSLQAARSYLSAASAYRSTGATLITPLHLTELASGFARLRRFDQARLCICDAMTTTNGSGESWVSAETHRVAGEIEQFSTQRDETKAQACFERSLEIARAQKARSFELRATTSLARLWRDGIFQREFGGAPLGAFGVQVGQADNAQMGILAAACSQARLITPQPTSAAFSSIDVSLRGPPSSLRQLP